MQSGQAKSPIALTRYVRQASCGHTDSLLFSQKGQHLERVDDFELPVQLFKNL